MKLHQLMKVHQLQARLFQKDQSNQLETKLQAPGEEDSEYDELPMLSKDYTLCEKWECVITLLNSLN